MRHMREVLERLDLNKRERINEYPNEKHFLLSSELIEKRHEPDRLYYVLTEKGARFRDKFIELCDLIKSEQDGRN
jgi:predicted transcriptional regulator